MKGNVLFRSVIEKIEVSDNKTVISITVKNVGNDSAVTWKTNKKVVGTGVTIDLKELCLIDDKFVRAEIKNNCGITSTQPFVLKYV